MAEGTTPLDRPVAPVELFYDLVFVFAVSQLSNHLLGDTSLRGAGETLVLLVAVFTVWILTSFEATYFDTARWQTQAAIIVAMAIGLFMNAAIPDAFTLDGGLMFAVPLVLTHLSRGILTAVAAPTAALRTHYRRMLSWLAASSTPWIIGATLDPAPRLWWWLAAAAIDLTGVWLAHPVPGRSTAVQGIPIDAEHMTERLRLFLLICLGEVVLNIGVAMSSAHTTLSLVAGMGGFVLVAALWATYFGGRATITSDHAGLSADPLWTIRMGANGQYIVLAGLIAVAVGCEQVTADPGAVTSPTLATLLFGGLLLFLGTHTWYLWATTRQPQTSRALACAALLVAGLASIDRPALFALLLATATLIALATHIVKKRAQHWAQRP